MNPRAVHVAPKQPSDLFKRLLKCSYWGHFIKRLAVHEKYDSLRNKIMGLKTKVGSYSIDDFDMEDAEDLRDLIDEDTYREG